MNNEFSGSILRALSQVHMSESERARAADKLHKSVALVEWMFTVVGVATRRKIAA